MQIEAILLTGGGSTRMGVDKARLVVGGVPLADGIAAALCQAAEKVTVLGREPIEGCAFLADQEVQAGPLSALARFSPEADLVFVASCDMPHFHPGILEVLSKKLDEETDAVVPVRAGILQPTCALYRSSCWKAIPDVLVQERKSLMAWLDRLRTNLVDEAALQEAGLAPIHFASFNTLEELIRIQANWNALTEGREQPPAPAG